MSQSESNSHVSTVSNYTKELNLACDHNKRWPCIKSLLASAIADKELAHRRVGDFGLMVGTMADFRESS